MALNPKFLIALGKKYYREKEQKVKESERTIRFVGRPHERIVHFDFTNVSDHDLVIETLGGSREVKFTSGEHSGSYVFPPLVMHLKDNGLRIYIKGEDGILYSADMFPNTSETSMCMGSVNAAFVDKMEFVQLVAMIESLFFDTFFSHEPSKEFLSTKNKKHFPWNEIKLKKIEPSTLLKKIYSTTKKK